MPEVLFADAANAGKVEPMGGGAIRVSARVSRTGVQTYAPWPGARVQGRPIKVYRPSEEVFSTQSLDSLKSIPVTVGHPAEREVTAKTWKRYAVGHVEGVEVQKATDGGSEYVETSIVIQDQKVVDKVMAKELTEISQGYLVDLAWEPGVTNDGVDYDAIQRNIRQNHTALLGAGKGRAGEGARVLLDSSAPIQGTPKMDEEEKKAFADSLKADMAGIIKNTVMEIMKTSDAGDETEEEKKKREEEEAAKKSGIPNAAKPFTKNDAAIEAERKEGELAARAALLDESEARATAVLDARDACRPMLPPEYAYSGKTARQMQTDAIAACAPALKITDSHSDEYVKGCFGALQAKKTQYVKVVDRKTKEQKDEGAVARKAHTERMNDGFDKSWGAN